jgi:tetratricopeptide (TPR) repeat protein
MRSAYESYTLASLAFLRGHDDEAQKFLLLAIKKDPESNYLNSKMALLLQRSRDYEGALKYALKCVAIEPDKVENRILLGGIYAFMGNDKLALEQYRKVLSVEPANDRIRLLLATILTRGGKFQDALRHIEKLIEQAPDLVMAHYYRGRINLEMGDYKKAENSFLNALKLNRAFEPALFDLATLYQMTDRNKDAIKLCETLLEFYPDNLMVRERLTNLYLKSGFEKKAEEQIEKIKLYTSPGAPSRQILGLLYLKQGRLNESIAELELIVSAWPKDEKTRYFLAAAYEENANFEKALEHFKLIDPESKFFIDSQVHIAHILNKQKRYEEAVTSLKKAVKKTGRVEFYLMLSSTYEAIQDYEKAIDTCNIGLERFKNNPELLFHRGVLFEKTGQRDSAIEQMQKIIQFDPDHADALNFIGYTYAEQGVKLDTALNMIKKALEFKPESGYILDSLGWVYFQKGMYNDAVYYLEKASGLTPDDPTIAEHLGDAYLGKKEYVKARRFYKKALLLNPVNAEKLKKKITLIQNYLKEKD